MRRRCLPRQPAATLRCFDAAAALMPRQRGYFDAAAAAAPADVYAGTI